ncbi:hypothetical protein SmJEL517_g05099 [Synchytrium microbalum]|uniref:CYRIA/CYRIB Rac1 binding domain-containing protein n=1 Tax=Synchytrium microbalum TaxID=1806994 RepID=A0A507BVS9_9FUNG|nr:uncharacterized protein SmJEL517_g05099 [Synchytrium microbalum]TPX31592.1 hypothetical protein SmJEL517_g05099 [Synchytrium microbalum]
MATSVEEVKQYLGQLDLSPCPIETPVLAAQRAAVVPRSLIDVNLADREVYELSTQAYFAREAGHISRLNDLLKDGRNLLSRLYSYRSLARAIPQVQSDQINKTEMYIRTVRILQPEIAKMRAFLSFRDSAVQVVSDVFLSTVQDIQEREFFPSVAFLNTLAAVFDLFVVMDAMKSIKGSMNNDLSTYKRALSDLQRNGLAEDETAINHVLYLFLGQQDQFINELKTALVTISGFDEIVQDMMYHCQSALESGQYVLCETKHMYLKAIAMGLFLLDDKGEEKDIYKRKKLKNTPVIPLFGDMPVSLSQIYGKAPHIGFGKWEDPDLDAKVALSKAYTITASIASVREDYQKFVQNFKRSLNLSSIAIQRYGILPPEENAALYELALQGLRLLSTWTARVLEQSAWKYANPVHPNPESGIPLNALSYELAVRYNYSKEDQRALVEMISMIKSLANLLSKIDRDQMQGISNHIYAEIQSFMRGSVGELLAHSIKKKRTIGSVLKHIRDIGLDGPYDDNAVAGKGPRPPPSDLKKRKNATSLTQLHFIRCLLDFCFNEKAKGMKGGLMREKDFKDAQVTEMQSFMDKSYFFPYILDFTSMVQRASDLSDLWFKEFYLELCKQVQFPISMSLPWILTETALESNNLEVMENIFFPFDIYNDAANRTLNSLRSKFVYDEIVAEMNLCFDQFIFKMCQKIFVHYKKAGAVMVLPPEIRLELEAQLQSSKDTPFSSFISILRQRELPILGRALNMTELIGQYMNQYLRRSIDVAISRYESSDLTYVVELETLLDCARATHTLLLEAGLPLDSFDSMLLEIDETVSLTCVNGRILTHTIQELIDDLIPNFAYNSVTTRYVRGPVSYVQELARPPMTKSPPMYLYGQKSIMTAFNATHGLYKDFVGHPHFSAVARLVGHKGLPLIVGELFRHTDMLVQNTMTAYINAIFKGIPQALKLPLFEYGTAGTFEYFSAHLKPLLSYKDLRPEVLQAFREVGNAILTVRILEEVITSEDTWTRIQTVAILNDTTEMPGSINSIKGLDEVLHTNEHVMPFGVWADKVDQLYKFAPPSSLLQPFLVRLKARLQRLDAEWKGDSAIPILESPRAFFRIWSALQFVFCNVPAANEAGTRAIFGEGLSWAGMTFIHLLGQVGYFNALDFNFHTLCVQRQDKRLQQQLAVPGGAGGLLRPEVSSFLESANFYSNLNDEIQDYLSCLLADS